MRRALILGGVILLAVLIGILGCSDKSVTTQTYNRITLNPQILPTLKSGLIYQGWLVKVDADTNWVSYESFGRFFWDAYNFRFLSESDITKDIGDTFEIKDNVYDYNYIAITLETVGPDDGIPSPTEVARSFVTPDILTRMGFPFSGSSFVFEGHFTMGTFSDGHFKEKGEGREDEDYGVWFMTTQHGSGSQDTVETYTQGLTLPALPDTGYMYEGWVIMNDGDTVSTGKFFSPAYIDYDNSHCLNGEIPNFPGEDFFLNKPAWIADSHWPLNLFKGGKAIITVEPSPDNDLTRPSNIVVLSGNMQTDTAAARTSTIDLDMGPISSRLTDVIATFGHGD